MKIFWAFYRGYVHERVRYVGRILLYNEVKSLPLISLGNDVAVRTEAFSNQTHFEQLQELGVPVLQDTALQHRSQCCA